MTETADQHVSFELTGSEDDTRFLVRNPVEIARIFRGLVQRNELVSAFFNNGRDLMLTAVLEVDQDRRVLLLDYGSNEILNQKILGAERIIFVTSLDSVKIQFASTQIYTDTYQHRDAFRVAIPDQVLQLQRREYYRLTTPIANPLVCLVPWQDDKTLQLALTDISGGGVGLLVPKNSGLRMDVRQMLPGCRIQLPEIGMLDSTLEVQNMFEVTLKNGHQFLHIGCQYVNLSPAMQTLVQRYMIKLERERIANNVR
jgi:c-di-GMP-binding flagellar brake protein YcgR